MSFATQPVVRVSGDFYGRFSTAKFWEMFEKSGVTVRQFRREFFGESENWAAGQNNKRLTRWTSGQVAPKIDTVSKFAQIFGCDVVDLYEEAAK